MLELRPIRENYGKPLPFNSGDAFICIFGCKFGASHIKTYPGTSQAFT